MCLIEIVVTFVTKLNKIELCT